MFPLEALEVIFRHQTLFQPGDGLPHAVHGVRIGFGYDLGHVTPRQFIRDWNGLLSPVSLAELLAVTGRTGDRLSELSPLLADIEIDPESARVVWVLTELGPLKARVAETFPGVKILPELAQGALASLVEWCGTNLDGDRHAEMRGIREVLCDVVEKPEQMPRATACRIIAHFVRCMKRHHALPAGVPMRERLDAEAELLERAAKH